MENLRRRRLRRGTGVLAGVSVLAGALAGVAIILVSSGEGGDVALAALGACVGAVLALAGVAGAVLAGSLAATRTSSLTLRAAAVGLGALIPSAAVIGLGVVPLIIAASLALSAIAPWRGGFARREADPLPEEAAEGPRASGAGVGP